MSCNLFAVQQIYIHINFKYFKFIFISFEIYILNNKYDEYDYFSSYTYYCYYYYLKTKLKFSKLNGNHKLYIYNIL